MKLTTQIVLSDAEFGKRTRQATCEMTGEKATLKNLLGDESPVPVLPKPESRANWFSKL